MRCLKSHIIKYVVKFYIELAFFGFWILCFAKNPYPVQNNRNMKMLSISFLLIVLCIHYHIQICDLPGNNSGEQEEVGILNV